MPAPHNPSTGFHDIKPIPNFPFAWPWFLALIIATALLLTALLWLGLKRRGSKAEVIVTFSPFEQTKHELQEAQALVDSESASIDQLSEHLSLVARAGLSRMLGIHARESTSRETLLLTEAGVRASFSSGESPELRNHLIRLRTLLSTCEKGEFSPFAPKDTAVFTDLITQMGEFIDWIEAMKTASVAKELAIAAR